MKDKESSMTISNQIFNFVKEINSEMDKFQDKYDTSKLEESLKVIQVTAGNVLGILEKQSLNSNDKDTLDSIMNVLIEIRSKMRQDKNFEISDFIRDRLKENGIQLKDTSSGVEWEIINQKGRRYKKRKIVDKSGKNVLFLDNFLKRVKVLINITY